jgi:hypothetical protein
MLANLMLSNKSTPLADQLTGIMIGNPILNCESANPMIIEFNHLYHHGLVSYAVYYEWTQNNCDSQNTTVCQQIYQKAVYQVGEIDQELVIISADDGIHFEKPAMVEDTVMQPSLDPDNLYQDFCQDNGTLAFVEDLGWPDQPGCYPSGVVVTDYLNRPEVQTAIYAKPTDWAICTDNYTYHQTPDSMIPYIRQLFNLKPSLNLLIYSGDVDIMVVPLPLTQMCMAELNDETNPPVATWQPWTVNGATAGYFESFQNYTLATVKGAGHEVPGYQRLQGYKMFQRFLDNQNLTESLDEFDDQKRKRLIQKAKTIHDRPVKQTAIIRALRKIQMGMF